MTTKTRNHSITILFRDLTDKERERVREIKKRTTKGIIERKKRVYRKKIRDIMNIKGLFRRIKKYLVQQ